MQNGAFEHYFINNMSLKLKDMLGIIKDIKNTIIKIVEKFINNYESLKKMINTYIDWLGKITPNIPDNNNILIKKDFNEEIRTKSKAFLDSLINISFINNLESIENSKNKLNDIFDEIINFNFSPPPQPENNIKLNLDPFTNIQNFDEENISINRQNFFQQVQEDENGEEQKSSEINSNDKSNNDKCCFCNKNKSCYFFSRKLYCKECINILFNKMIDDKENPDWDNVLSFNSKKEIFIFSLEILIKIILLKCNYILNNDSKISRNIQNNQILEIKKFKYPMINPENSELNFIEKINSVLVNDLHADFQEFSEENFNPINLNGNIRESFRKILNDENITSTKKKIEKVDDFFEGYNNNIFDFDPNDFRPDNLKNENFIKEDKESQEIKKKSKTIEDYYLLINLISKRQESFKGNINFENEIVKSFNINFTMNKSNILFSYNRSFLIDEIIRTKKFNNLSLIEVKNNYQYFNELYEFKKIVDELLVRQCNIDKKLIDYKGHFIVPNKSNNFIRGKEKYYPPYGWIGIGLKVLGKYSNDDSWITNSSKGSKWSTAYHGVGGNLPSSEVLKKLNKKIINGLEDGESQYKCNYYDKRHKNKKIGTGVYLTPNINICENYSGQISFNKTKYKIALMVKVLNDKIKEPEDINFWIVNKKYIRIYRILIKKIVG